MSLDGSDPCGFFPDPFEGAVVVAADPEAAEGVLDEEYSNAYTEAGGAAQLEV